MHPVQNKNNSSDKELIEYYKQKIRGFISRDAENIIIPCNINENESVSIIEHYQKNEK